jgi:hypothetical protein
VLDASSGQCFERSPGNQAVLTAPHYTAFMTRMRTARIAGVTYLLYAAVGICTELLMHRARGVASGHAAQLAHIGERSMDVRLAVLCMLLESFCALVLAATLYAITRDQDRELALFAFACRVAEGILGASSIPSYLGIVWLAKSGGTLDVATTNALRESLMMPVPAVPIGAIFFAAGSLTFSWLFLRGRIVPPPIAWLGVLGSALLVVTLPLQLAGFDTAPVTGYVQWLPALVFQIAVALWLIVRGAAMPARPIRAV